jgi:hypothetical protein
MINPPLLLLFVDDPPLLLLLLTELPDVTRSVLPPDELLVLPLFEEELLLSEVELPEPELLLLFVAEVLPALFLDEVLEPPELALLLLLAALLVVLEFAPELLLLLVALPPELILLLLVIALPADPLLLLLFVTLPASVLPPLLLLFVTLPALELPPLLLLLVTAGVHLSMFSEEVPLELDPPVIPLPLMLILESPEVLVLPEFPSNPMSMPPLLLAADEPLPPLADRVAPDLLELTPEAELASILVLPDPEFMLAPVPLPLIEIVVAPCPACFAVLPWKLVSEPEFEIAPVVPEPAFTLSLLAPECELDESPPRSERFAAFLPTVAVLPTAWPFSCWNPDPALLPDEEFPPELRLLEDSLLSEVWPLPPLLRSRFVIPEELALVLPVLNKLSSIPNSWLAS